MDVEIAFTENNRLSIKKLPLARATEGTIAKTLAHYAIDSAAPWTHNVYGLAHTKTHESSVPAMA